MGVVLQEDVVVSLVAVVEVVLVVDQVDPAEADKAAEEVAQEGGEQEVAAASHKEEDRGEVVVLAENHDIVCCQLTVSVGLFPVMSSQRRALISWRPNCLMCSCGQFRAFDLFLVEQDLNAQLLVDIDAVNRCDRLVAKCIVLLAQHFNFIESLAGWLLMHWQFTEVLLVGSCILLAMHCSRCVLVTFLLVWWFWLSIPPPPGL